MMNRKQTCCFTGHRFIPAEQYAPLKERLTDTIKSLIDRDVLYYGAGGALGFDTIAAQCIIEQKKCNPSIKLILVLPCYSQAQKWSVADQQTYEAIKTQADKIVYTSKEYTRDCMFKRNRHLVDYSGICVCYMTKASGGTAYTVDYAKRQGLEIINLAKQYEDYVPNVYP